MTQVLTSQLLKRHANCEARCMLLQTPHGDITTPTFMPVGTRAFVNHMTPNQLLSAGSQIILGGNTYHMLCHPGMDFIRELGGMHNMMGWQKPMLTDSGGFQVFSLAQGEDKCCQITEEGAVFKHPETRQAISLTPASSIAAQKIIGADIIMAFDECTPETGGRDAAERALERTHRWLLESVEAHQQQPDSAYGQRQALFGIVQGGRFRDLRERSAEFVASQPIDGLALGGEVIGFDMEQTQTVIDTVLPLVDERLPRYTMGVGLEPNDLIKVVQAGIDMFDCVAPTRNARHGTLYTGRFEVSEAGVQLVPDQEGMRTRLLIKKQQYAGQDEPIMARCDCETCHYHSRGYLHYLYKTKSPLYYNLASVHNIRVMQKTCELLQAWIMAS